MPDTTTTTNTAPSTSGSVQGIIEAAYTSTAQWFEQCTSTAIGRGGTATKSDSSSSIFPHQQQQQQQHHEEKDDETHVVEQHASNGDAGRDNAIVPSTLAKATNDDDDDNEGEGEEDEEKTEETHEVNDEPRPSSSSSSSEQFTKVVEDALEGYSLSVCINPFWATTGGDDHGSKSIANQTSTETQRSKQQKKKKKKKHKKKKDNHEPKRQQKCSDGNVGEHSTERKCAWKENVLDKSDDTVVTNDHGPTTPPSDTVVEPRTATCTIDVDHDDIDDDEMDDTIDSWATRGSVGTIQTNYTTTVGGNNTVMSSSVRSDTRSIHSFLMVNEPHRPSRTFSMTASNQPQSYSLSHRYTKPQNSPFTPSKPSSLLQSQRSPYQDKNNKHMSLAPPSMGLTESITETDEEVTSPTNNVLTPSLMQQIKHHLPFGRRDDSFWLQYSMVRDGASIGQLLHHVVDCNCRYSVLAVETMDGEIFGAYLSHSWEQPQPKHWHGGGESFLWTTAYHDAGEAGVVEAARAASSIYSKPPSVREMNVGAVKNRPSSSNSNNRIRHSSSSPNDQNGNNGKDSTQLHVYHYTFANSYVQLCEHDRLLMGGGFSSAGGNQDEGFGLALDGDLFMGSSHPCPTFGNPPLSFVHRDGSPFEIRNIEVWSLHPCLSLVESNGRKVVHRSRSFRPKTKTPKSSSSSEQQLSSRRKQQGPVLGTQSMSEDFESSDKRLDPYEGNNVEKDNDGFDPYGRKEDRGDDQLVSATW